MRRRQSPADDVYDSDSSSSPGVEGQSDDLTEPTDIEDLSEDEDIDLKDPDEDDKNVDSDSDLFGGNVHPLEYYRQGMEDSEDSESDGEDYSLGTSCNSKGLKGSGSSSVPISSCAIPKNASSPLP